MKADLNAITNVIDFALGGIISTTKANILAAYAGYLSEKLDSLIKQTIENNVQENELKFFIDNITESEKDILYSVIRKTLDSKDRIIIYILANILAKQIKIGKLNYYEDSLLTNIDTFNEADFVNFLKLVDSLEVNDKTKTNSFKITPNCNEEETSLVKFIKLGFFKENQALILTQDQTYHVFKIKYVDEFYNLIQEYYKN